MSEILRRFTRRKPEWRPRVTPVAPEEATEAQREAMQVTPSGTGATPYVLTLAHDPEALRVRSPLFNAIMYDPGGLSRAERELGAIAASIVNRCIYCAAIHAERHARLAGETDTTDRLFADGPEAALPPRERAILDYATALSRTPPEAGPEHVARLRGVGLTDEEVLDLTLSTALFGWANRLMHVLGDPVRAS